MFSLWLNIDVDSVIGFSYRVIVGDIADVSAVQAATLKTEAACTSETSVRFNKTTRLNKPRTELTLVPSKITL
jgi:hypothetical protein